MKEEERREGPPPLLFAIVVAVRLLFSRTATKNTPEEFTDKVETGGNQIDQECQKQKDRGVVPVLCCGHCMIVSNQAFRFNATSNQTIANTYYNTIQTRTYVLNSVGTSF